MEQSLALVEAAQTGDIEALYALLRQSPYLLEDIDKIPFVDTPLHTAASAGCTPFAIEILRLKPSFAKKLNPDGYSPIDLALTSRQTQTVTQLIRHDPELIPVKSKEGFTPLHYVTEMDDADLLAEFLVRCPESIEDLTIRGENAAHIAVRYRKMRAFKVLLGWLFEADLEQILNSQDDKGDTVLHIAASTNNLEAVNLIMKRRRINKYKKNVEGLTAFDIARRLPNAEDNGSIAKRLDSADSIIFSALSEISADRFISISEASCLRQYLVRLSSPIIKELSGRNAASSDETRQGLLVVMVLIATATYQAILTPPSVLAQAKDKANNLKSSFRLLLKIKSSSVSRLLGFLVLNSMTFLVSMLSMWHLFKTDVLGFLVKMSLTCLVLCYAVVMLSYFPFLGHVALLMVLWISGPTFMWIHWFWPRVKKYLSCVV